LKAELTIGAITKQSLGVIEKNLVFAAYPRWVYSASMPKGQIIQTEDELFGLSGQWFSHPDFRPESRIDLAASVPVYGSDFVGLTLQN
jgi:hypothetical protein